MFQEEEENQKYEAETWFIFHSTHRLSYPHMQAEVVSTRRLTKNSPGPGVRKREFEALLNPFLAMQSYGSHLPSLMLFPHA